MVREYGYISIQLHSMAARFFNAKILFNMIKLKVITQSMQQILNLSFNVLVDIITNANPYEVMFDCYLNQRMSTAGIVKYHGCFVDTTDGAINKDSGIFTTKVDGIYQFSFTAKYVSSSKGRFGAWSDIMVNQTVNISSIEQNAYLHSGKGYVLDPKCFVLIILTCLSGFLYFKFTVHQFPKSIFKHFKALIFAH